MTDTSTPSLKAQMQERDALRNFDDQLASFPITDDARTEARLCAVQAVFQWRMLELDDGIEEQFLKGAVRSRKAQKKLFSTLYSETKMDCARYVEVVASCLQEDWGFERVDTTVQAILLVATAELSTQADTPTAAVLTEYLTLTRAFEGEKQVSFVHGVLNAVAQKVR